jgi:outer membrane protein insertion porin family
MASAGAAQIDDIFSKLRDADPKELERRQQAINDRLEATFRKSQERLAQLIDQNSTLPTTVSSVTVLGAPNTRHSFLKGVVNPLLSANRDRPYTQAEVVREAAAAAEKLRKFGERQCWTMEQCAERLTSLRNFPRPYIDLPRQT